MQDFLIDKSSGESSAIFVVLITQPFAINE